MGHAPRPSGARPRRAPGLHPALRSPSSLAHRLGPEGLSLRLTLPSGRTGLARWNRIAPRIRAPQDTSRRPGARGLSRMCTFVQVRESLPACGPLVPDPRTSCWAVMCATGSLTPGFASSCGHCWKPPDAKLSLGFESHQVPPRTRPANVTSHRRNQSRVSRETPLVIVK